MGIFDGRLIDPDEGALTGALGKAMKAANRENREGINRMSRDAAFWGRFAQDVLRSGPEGRRRSCKGGRVVPAALPYCLMEGLLCQTVQQMTGLALLEIEKKVLKPTFVGDTVHSEVEVVAIKPTSRGNRAVVTTINNIVNQKGETVITYKAVRMMAGRAPQ